MSGCFFISAYNLESVSRKVKFQIPVLFGLVWFIALQPEIGASYFSIPFSYLYSENDNYKHHNCEISSVFHPAYLKLEFGDKY